MQKISGIIIHSFFFSTISLTLSLYFSLREKDLSAKVIIQVDGHKTSVLNMKVCHSVDI